MKRLALLVLARILPDDDILKQLVRFVSPLLTSVCGILNLLHTLGYPLLFDRLHKYILTYYLCWLQEWFHNFDWTDHGYLTHQDLHHAAKERGMALIDAEVCVLWGCVLWNSRVCCGLCLESVAIRMWKQHASLRLIAVLASASPLEVGGLPRKRS